MQPPSFFVALCDDWVNLGTIRGWKDHLWREDSLTPPQMPTYFFKDKKKHYKTDVTRCEDFVLLWRGRYRGANLLGWVCQEDLGHWSLPQANLIPVLEQNQAKLYYTSFWDKFGMNINYFGMHPKTKKKVWDGSQVKAFPNPDHPPLEIFLTYPSFRTKLKNLCLFEVIYQSIWLRWKWKFISLYIVKLSWNDHDCLHNMFFGSISVCIS